MKTLLALTLAGACSAASAQTPATNPMPDGSRDLYLGLGVTSGPDYGGAASRRSRVQPLLQLEWSNGIFISGLSAGIHLAHDGPLEFGPLVAWNSGRDEDGDGAGAGGVKQQSIPGRVQPNGGISPMLPPAPHGLVGMDQISARLQGGVFANYYLTPQLRLTNSVLYGAGKWREGLVWQVGLQTMAADLTAHHQLSWTVGATVANASYNNSFYGISETEAGRSNYRSYFAGSGLQNVYLGAGWTWALSPSWIVTTQARATRLQGDARHSPLVQRPTTYTVSTGLAYRF